MNPVTIGKNLGKLLIPTWGMTAFSIAGGGISAIAYGLIQTTNSLLGIENEDPIHIWAYKYKNEITYCHQALYETIAESIQDANESAFKTNNELTQQLTMQQHFDQDSYQYQEWLDQYESIWGTRRAEALRYVESMIGIDWNRGFNASDIFYAINDSSAASSDIAEQCREQGFENQDESPDSFSCFTNIEQTGLISRDIFAQRYFDKVSQLASRSRCSHNIAKCALLVCGVFDEIAQKTALFTAAVGREGAGSIVASLKGSIDSQTSIQQAAAENVLVYIEHGREISLIARNAEYTGVVDFIERLFMPMLGTRPVETGVFFDATFRFMWWAGASFVNIFLPEKWHARTSLPDECGKLPPEGAHDLNLNLQSPQPPGESTPSDSITGDPIIDEIMRQAEPDKIAPSIEVTSEEIQDARDNLGQTIDIESEPFDITPEDLEIQGSAEGDLLIIGDTTDLDSDGTADTASEVQGAAAGCTPENYYCCWILSNTYPYEADRQCTSGDIREIDELVREAEVSHDQEYSARTAHEPGDPWVEGFIWRGVERAKNDAIERLRERGYTSFSTRILKMNQESGQRYTVHVIVTGS